MQRTIAPDRGNAGSMHSGMHRRQLLTSLLAGSAAAVASTSRAAAALDLEDPAASCSFVQLTDDDITERRPPLGAHPEIRRSRIERSAEKASAVSNAGATTLVILLKKAARGEAVVDAHCSIRLSRNAEPVMFRSDSRGRVVLHGLKPDVPIEIAVRSRKGRDGHFGALHHIRPIPESRSYAVIWLIDNYWEWEDGGSRHRFPVEFFLETTFTPRLVRFRHPGDGSAAHRSPLLSGRREMTFFIDPAFDDTAQSIIRSIIAGEWAAMTDFRISPRFETAFLPTDDPRVRDAFCIVHDPLVNIALLHQNVDAGGYLINSRISLAGSPDWREKSPYIIDLHCEFVREYAGFAIGPRYYDNKPWNGGASFMRYPGARRYTWFDRNVVARVMYRLPANTVLYRGDVASL